MSDLADALREPIALAPNRIPRFYRGGRLIDAFRGFPEAADDDRPEDWVGSATRAWSAPGTPASELGVSTVEIRGKAVSLETVVRHEPEAMAGPDLVRRAGPTLGVLVKLLDAAERLPVHCHPSRSAATRLLGSRFGKTEAWLILGTRDGGVARIWAGFREAVSASVLRGWIDEQDTETLLGSLVEHPVAPGDAFLIPAGMPHAIGAGIFLLELQEPTDFSVVAETRGFPVSVADASLGLGWDRAIELFDTDAAPDLRQAPRPEAGGLTRLLGPEADPYFRAMRLTVDGEAGVPVEPAFAIGVVLGGSGEVVGHRRSVALERGVTFALPFAAVPEARLAGDGLEIVLCLPPEPDLI